MKVSVEQVSPIEKKLFVEVPPEQVEKELERVYQGLSRSVKIPGFRPGKVPRRILEARFKDQVEGEVIQHLVERSFLEVVSEKELRPVAPPVVTNEKLALGEPFRYQARVEVKPELAPHGYRDLPVKRAQVEIAGAEVDAEIERLRESLAQLVPVEGRETAQEDDFAIIDFDGSIESRPFPGGKGEKVTVRVQKGEFVEGKIAALQGMKAGDTKEMDYAFAKDYQVESLRGKVARFKVTLRSIKTKRVPAADDELAKDLDAGQSLGDLKARVKEQLEARKKAQAEREAREAVIKALVEKNPFEVPGAMVERAIDIMLQGAIDALARQGVDAAAGGLNFRKLREELREKATLEVKGSLLLEAIAKKESLAVSDEELEAKIASIAEEVKAPLEKVRFAYKDKGEREGLRARLREEKTLELLLSKAGGAARK